MAATEWVGGRLRAPMFVGDDGGYQPDIVVWLDTTHDRIVGANIVHPADPPQVLTDCLTTALRAPLVGARGRPARVRVADDSTAEPVRKILGTGVDVRVAPTPELERVLDHMAETMPDAGGLLVGYMTWLREEQELVPRLFHAAARLHRAKPWDLLWDSDRICVEVPELGVTGACASVIGRLKEAFGLALFRSLDDYDAMREADPDDVDESDLVDIGSEFLSLTFDGGKLLPKSIQQEIVKRGWEVASEQAFPMFVYAGRAGRPRAPTRDEARLLLAAIEGTSALVERHRAELAEGCATPLTLEVPVSTADGPLAVRLTAPYPGTSWDDEDDEEDLDDVERDEAYEYAETLTQAFVKAERARLKAEGKTDFAWLHAAASASDFFLRFKIDCGDGNLGRFTPAQVEEFLLEFVPRKITLDEESIERLPTALLAFFDWMADTGRLPKREHRSLAARIRASEPKFRRYARDESRFGMAKSMATEMLRAGIDLSDEDEVQDYIADRNADMAATLGHGPSPASARTPEPTRPARQRWQPTAGEPPPEPAAPCPCGSGRRYKKCCLRR